MKRIRIGAAVLGVALAAGCGQKGGSPSPLKPAAFYPPAQAQPEAAQATGGAGSAQTTTVAPAENASLQKPATTASAESLPSVSSGRYLTVGTVVAEVNGKPVYADQVLAWIEPVLRARAAELDEPRFRNLAARLIQQRVEEVIHDELEFAAAQRNNSIEDEQLAGAVTTKWRQEQITKAGGSLPVAQRRSLRPEDNSQGMDFDERVKEEYRRNMVRIYYTRQIWPQVQVLADDLRWYYDHNTKEFTDKAGIRFRVIRKGVKESGGGSREKAFERIKDIWERANRGDDFERLAQRENDNRTWAKNGGFMEMVEEPVEDTDDPTATPMTRRVPAWFEHGSLRAEELEKALFALNPGEITGIIDGRDGYFYIAKLEEKKDGRTRPFEDREVQEYIRRKLETQQRAALRRKEQLKLLANAVVRTEDKQLDTAVDMAMQMYAAWKNR